MGWPFRWKPTQAERYQQVTTDIGEGLFGASVLLTNEMKEGWTRIHGAPALTNEQSWSIVEEVLWYLLARCRKALLCSFQLESNQVERGMCKITERSLDKFMGAFDFKAMPIGGEQEQVRELQRKQLRDRQAKAALDYSRPVEPISAEQRAEILRTGSLVPGSDLDRLAQRIESIIGMPLGDGGGDSSDVTRCQKDVYERVTQHGVNLEDIYVVTIGKAGNRVTEMLRERGVIEALKAVS